MKQKYRSQVYNVLQAFTVCGLIVFLTLGSIILISVSIKSATFGVIALILMFVVPFFFQKKVKEHFTREVLLEFKVDAFVLNIYSLRKADKATLIYYNWEDIGGYKFYFTPSELTYLDLYLRNGKRKEFAFKENKDQEESIKPGNASIFNIFRSFVADYNIDKKGAQKIMLKPGSLTTKRGGLWLSFAGILTILAIIFLVVNNSGSFAFLFVGLSAYLPLLAKRKSDKRLYDRICEME